jgi:N6-adenosine-specific RNA methylase IME4
MVTLPQGQFDVILLDPPWSHYGQQDKWGAAAKFYSLMDDDALRAMPVARLAKRASVVFCWATCPRLDFAIDLLRHWGFHYRGVAFTWVKTTKEGRPIGARGVRPSIVKPTTELVLAASMTAKGRPMPIADEGVPQVVLAAPTRHSEKPAEVYTRIERLYPRAAKLELFARGRRDGWEAWGDDPAVATSDC